MQPFEDHAKSFIVNALERVPADAAPDVYVVSLFVYDEEDDPHRPTATVGFNTESQVAASTDDASDAHEARWNFAFWLQNYLGVLCDSERDTAGVALRDDWLRRIGLGSSAEPFADGEDADAITSRFVELLVTLAQQLHQEGTIARIFGRPIPILIHELEYYDGIAEQNLHANPDGLAQDFARWVYEM